MRKEVRVTIEDAGTMHNFVIRQMPASQLEWWIIRAIQCIGPALDVSNAGNIEAIGKAISKKGLSALSNIDPEKAKPLLDEMLATASRVVDGVEYPCDINTVDGYMETLQALFKLRVECFKANFDFFKKGSPSTSHQEKQKVGKVASSPIRMSRP